MQKNQERPRGPSAARYPRQPARRLEVTSEQLARELAVTKEPAEDSQGKIEKLKAQFNAANMEVAIRKLLFLARSNGDEQAKSRLIPIVRELIQTVVVFDTLGAPAGKP